MTKVLQAPAALKAAADAFIAFDSDEFDVDVDYGALNGALDAASLVTKKVASQYANLFSLSELKSRLECSEIALERQYAHAKTIGGTGSLGKSIIAAESINIANIKAAIEIKKVA